MFPAPPLHPESQFHPHSSRPPNNLESSPTFCRCSLQPRVHPGAPDLYAHQNQADLDDLAKNAELEEEYLHERLRLQRRLAERALKAADGNLDRALWEVRRVVEKEGTDVREIERACFWADKAGKEQKGALNRWQWVVWEGLRLKGEEEKRVAEIRKRRDEFKRLYEAKGERIASEILFSKLDEDVKEAWDAWSWRERRAPLKAVKRPKSPKKRPLDHEVGLLGSAKRSCKRPGKSAHIPRFQGHGISAPNGPGGESQPQTEMLPPEPERQSESLPEAPPQGPRIKREPDMELDHELFSSLPEHQISTQIPNPSTQPPSLPPAHPSPVAPAPPHTSSAVPPSLVQTPSIKSEFDPDRWISLHLPSNPTTHSPFPPHPPPPPPPDQPIKTNPDSPLIDPALWHELIDLGASLLMTEAIVLDDWNPSRGIDVNSEAWRESWPGENAIWEQREKVLQDILRESIDWEAICGGWGEVGVGIEGGGGAAAGAGEGEEERDREMSNAVRGLSLVDDGNRGQTEVKQEEGEQIDFGNFDIGGMDLTMDSVYGGEVAQGIVKVEPWY